jgi:hypothetical protein
LETTLKYAVPKNALRKAMGLWNYLKDRKGTLVDWNEDGEVSVHGQSIIGSHMIDLGCNKLYSFLYFVLERKKRTRYDIHKHFI